MTNVNLKLNDLKLFSKMWETVIEFNLDCLALKNQYNTNIDRSTIYQLYLLIT